MAKYTYEEFELDEHDLATHWRERTGVECWAYNEYFPNGQFKDVHITKMFFPKGYENAFGHVYEQDEIVEFGE